MFVDIAIIYGTIAVHPTFLYVIKDLKLRLDIVFDQSIKDKSSRTNMPLIPVAPKKKPEKRALKTT